VEGVPALSCVLPLPSLVSLLGEWACGLALDLLGQTIGRVKHVFVCAYVCVFVCVCVCMCVCVHEVERKKRDSE